MLLVFCLTVANWRCQPHSLDIPTHLVSTEQIGHISVMLEFLQFLFSFIYFLNKARISINCPTNNLTQSLWLTTPHCQSNSFTPEQLITAVAKSNDRSQFIENHLNLTDSARIFLDARQNAIESRLVNLLMSRPSANGLQQVKDHLQANS